MKETRRKQVKIMGLVWAGCLVVCLLAYMVVISPKLKANRDTAGQLSEKKHLYETAVQASEEKTQAQLKEQIEALQGKMGDFVTDFEASADLTLDISRLAAEKNVSSFSIRGKTRLDSKESEIPGCKQICENRIEISFLSNFTGFATFLNALERHRPVVFIDQFKITRADDGSSAHKVDMELAAFFKKQKADTNRQSI